MPGGDELEAGRLFESRYEIAGILGSGSFGRVYQARQLSTGQLVALKILRVDDFGTWGDDRTRATERFRREMRLCAALSHPNIVRLVDFGEVAEGLYTVFELVPGLTLRQTLDSEGRLKTIEALYLMEQVLDALSCAHAQGVVHRDLKPENIMITKTGARRNAKVLDFGLGVLLAEQGGAPQTRVTVSGELLGTPCYAAPEQLRGEAVSPAADLYSWGLILLECLTGEVAVGGESAYEVISRQLGPEAIRVPRSVRPARLHRLLSVVTNKHPAKRSVTAAQLLDSIAEIARDLSPAEESVLPVVQDREGERRYVTIVAVRLRLQRAEGVASDPEELDAVVQGLRQICVEISEARGGTIVGLASDRLLLGFGYPRTRETDADHAVRAALQIVAKAREASLGSGCEVSAGVHSGLVVSHERTTLPGVASYDLVGEAPGIAVAIAERVGGGEVLVSAETWRALRGRMAGAPAGTVPIEGGDEGLAVYRASPDERDAAHKTSSASEAPLVNREVETAQVRRAWQQSAAGEPTALLLLGEAGIGKSRIVRELRRSVPADRWLECGCTAEDQQSPLQPVVNLLASLSEPVEALLDRHDFDLAKTMPLFGGLLSAPASSQYRPLLLPPERIRELTLSAIASLLIRMAIDRPLAFVVEDVHWADPTTVAFLNVLAEELRAITASPTAATRLCVLLTARLDTPPPWTGDISVVSLSRLSRSDVKKLVGTTVGASHPLPEEVVDRIADRTDGVPLFVEELSHALAYSRLANARQPPVAVSEPEIPATLRALISERLEWLSAGARETAQLAAALGREFRYDVLQAMTTHDTWSLRQDVDELVAARLLYTRRGAEPESYVFKHSLVRDAAYDGMRRAARRRAHERIARVLINEFGDITRKQPEVVAQHFERANEPVEAAVFWQRAGDRALRRAAYVEAKQHLQNGLAALTRVPDSAERQQREIALLTTLGTVLFTTQGYTTPEVETTFTRARLLCEELGRAVPPEILSGVIGVHLVRGDREATDALLPQFTALASCADDPVASVTGHTTLGINDFWRGHHASAQAHLDTAMGGYVTDAFQQFARDYGYDGGQFCFGYAVWNLLVLGRPAQASVVYERLAALARESFDPYAVPLALCFGMALAYERRERDETDSRAEQLVAIASDHRAYLLLAIGMCGRGAARVLAGKPAAGIPDIRQGLDLIRASGANIFYGYYLTYLAAAYAAAGQVDDGLAVVEEGLALCGELFACFHEAEYLRLRAELLIVRGEREAAESCLNDALALAKRNAALSLELRCANSLMRLLRDSEREEHARSVVRVCYERFEEGFDLAELREAARFCDAPD